MGDFNINLLNCDCNNFSNEFLDVFLTNFYKPLIVQPTYFTEKGNPSLIDNIFYNGLENDCISGNFVMPITDHLPNFLIITKHKVQRNIIKTKRRNFSEFDINKFKKDFDDLNLNENILCLADVNDKCDKLQDSLQDLFEKHVPLQTISRKKAKQKMKPWITNGILKSISKKNSFYANFMHTKNQNALKMYKYYRNKINHLIRKSKYCHFKNYFSDYSNNIKKMWYGIKTLTKGKKRSNETPSCIKVNNDLQNDPKIISNSLNSYFCNIANNLVNKINTNNSADYSKYLKKSNDKSFFISPVTHEEIKDELNSLDESKAADIYDTDIRIVKMISSQLCFPLADIINESFSSGIFPNNLKHAKVTPLFKGGDKCEPGNYRPVSILPLFDKIIEKVMKRRLVKFLNNNKILCDAQFGFRKNKSTSMSVIDIIFKVYDALEKKEIPCCLFLDFAKAFDTVDHSILLSKLSHYGIKRCGK